MLNTNGVLILGNMGLSIINIGLMVFIYRIRCKVEMERRLRREPDVEEDTPSPQKTLAPEEPPKKEEPKDLKTSGKVKNQINLLEKEIERLKTL